MEFPLEIATAILILSLLVLLYAKYKNGYWKRKGIPYKEPELFFGNCRRLILKQDSFGDTFSDIYFFFKDQNLPIGGFYLAMKSEIMLVDIDIVKHVMIKDFQHFTDRGGFVDEKNDPLTGHLFALGGKKWKNLRAKLTPTFTSGKMKMMFQTLVDTSKEMDSILGEKSRLDEPLDIKEILARFTTDVIGSCAFGIDCNCLRTPDTDFRKYGAQSFNPQGVDLVRQLFAVTAPWVLKLFKIRGINKNISDFFINLVKDTVDYRERNNVFRKDFMHLLIQLKNQGKVSEDESVVVKNGKGLVNSLTIEEVAAQSFVFFLAGFETSSTTMTFCLYELATNQDIQDKLREEVVQVLAKHGGNLTYEAITDMTYMDKVVNETLRKYPPLPFLVRQCTADYHLPKTNLTLKKGQYVRISVQGIHRDPEYYPDPDKFDPERFSEEEKARRPACAWMPFGEGPRICIGLRFGMMQTKVGLSVLLKNYKFTISPKTKVPLEMDPKSFIMSTKGGIWLDIHDVAKH